MSDEPQEIPLDGGNVNAGVVRVGDTVRRGTSPHSPSAHRLLKHIENKGFNRSPKFMGIDDKGREILSYLPGETEFPPDLWENTAGLRAAAEMLRDLHLAAEGFTPDTDDSWAMIYPDASRHNTICHNDFAPYNMVFEDGIPVGIFDFDLAGPGPALRDVAYLAYWFAPLSFASEDLSVWSRREVAAGCPRLRLICEICDVQDITALLEMVSEVLQQLGDEAAVVAVIGPEATDRLKEGGHFEHWIKEAKAFDAMRPELVQLVT